MQTPGWYGRCFAGTRGRIVALLRREGRTVRELAEALGMTDNAVRAHLSTLESDGLVRRSGRRAGLRKPHVAYDLTPEAEQLFARAYAPFLGQFLEVVLERLPADTRTEILRETGHRLAARYLPALTGHDAPDRLAAAVALLDGLGGLTETQGQDNTQWISSAHCPLSRVAAEQPGVCLAMEALLSEVVGMPVQQRCERSETPKCRFEITSES